jgi:hypothetical protein
LTSFTGIIIEKLHLPVMIHKNPERKPIYRLAFLVRLNIC